MTNALTRGMSHVPRRAPSFSVEAALPSPAPSPSAPMDSWDMFRDSQHSTGGTTEKRYMPVSGRTVKEGVRQA